MKPPTKQPIRPAPTHPLVGAGLHFKSEEGEVLNQAHIVAVFPTNGTGGDAALIEYFGWLDGGPTNRRLILVSELATDQRWTLYASVAAMSDHFERIDQHRNKWIQRQRDAAAKGEAAASEPGIG